MSRASGLQDAWNSIRSARKREFMRSAAESVSYREMTDTVRRFCAEFDERGVAPGSRILIVCTNEAIAGAAFLAALFDGIIPVMLAGDSGTDRVHAISHSLQPSLIIGDSERAEELLEPGQAKLPSDLSMICVPSDIAIGKRSERGSAFMGILDRLNQKTPHGDIDLPLRGREPRLPAVDDTTAYVLFTSGTTKAPSGVQISRNALIAHLETLGRLFEYDSGSRIFNATPFAHTDGLVQGLLLATFNCAAVLRPGVFSLNELEEWLDRLSEFGATHFITNPTVLGLIDRFASHDDYFAHDEFFGILSSASILRPALWQRLESRFGCPVYNMYGMTETVANATYAGRHPEMGAAGTIGVPVDCEVRLIAAGDDGTQCENARRGEIQLRGENIFQGYWKDSARTERTLVGDGWMRTGDLAQRRDDGSLEIMGRVSTVINMGGQSILPEEIDEVLASHPAVRDVATVGMPDPDFEEIAISAVVLDSSLSETELTEYCRARLERLKIPKRIIFVEEIPRGGAGKPKTGELRGLLTPLISRRADATGHDGAVEVSAEEIFELAAQLFRVPVEDLDATSSPASVNGWDSFNQLNLMIEAEQRFGIKIPASAVARIRTLGDLHEAITGKA